MNAKQFFDEVVRLRMLQKKYFKDRSSMSLTTCKRQEKVIDDEIARVQKALEEKKKNKEPELIFK